MRCRDVADRKPTRKLERQRGAALIEFALMLPLFVIFMMFLLIVYDLTSNHVTLQVKAYADLRSAIQQVGGGGTRQVVGRAVGGTRIDGGMAQILERSYIPVDLQMVGIGGSCQGLRRNWYRRNFFRYQ